MDTIARFIASGCRTDIKNYDEYIENIYRFLRSHNMMKTILAEPSSTKKYTVDSFIGGNVVSYQIMYSNVSCGITDNWYIDLSFRINNMGLQLQVNISSHTYRLCVEEEYLLKLEELIERCICADWTSFVWVADRYSDLLNSLLFPELHRTENIVRRMVFEVMNRVYGVQWWKEYGQDFFKKNTGFAEYAVGEGTEGEFAVSDEYPMNMNITDFYKVVNEEWKEFFSGYFSEEFLECMHEMSAAYEGVINNRRCSRCFYEKSRAALETVRKEAAPVLWRLEHIG